METLPSRFGKKVFVNTLLVTSLILSPITSWASERLVSAGSGVTELVLAINEGKTLVAVDSTSKVPDDLVVEKLGYHRALAAEGILALSPSLLVGSDAMGPKRTLDILSQAGVKVVALPQADNQQTLVANIQTLGDLLDKVKQAEQLTEEVNALAANIEFKRSQLNGKSPRVLFMLLQADRPARVGGQGFAADILINLAGGKNVADFNGYKSLSQEGVMALNPDIILISKRSENNDFSADEVLEQMPLLSHTPAGQNGNIAALPPQSLIGGLGLSALETANELADKFLKIQGVVIPLTAKK